MGRFTKLEFDHGREPQGKQETAPAVGPDTCFLQAEREYREGNFENALRYYSRTLEGDRLMVEAWRRQVLMLVELEEFGEAALWADKAMELFPDDVELLSGKASALCRLGDLSTSLKVIDRALALPGASASPWIARGELMLVKREARHEYCFSKAVAIAPGGWNTLVRIGRAYQYHGLYSKALEYFKRAMAIEPGILLTLVETARCQNELGLHAAARKTLDQVLRISPRHAEARKLLDAASSPRAGASARGFFRRLFGR